MSAPIHGPTSHTYYSQRLRLHYVDWGNEGAPPMLLVHGGRDHCRNWDWVAEALRDDYHIIAPDLRGHGDSQWVVGSNYAMIDYVYDIAQLLHQRQTFPITVISHSLGGSISMEYAGIYPENVAKLVSIEGMGPPPHMIEARRRREAHERMAEWIEQVRGLAGRLPRRYATLDEAARRMLEANSFLSEEQAWHLTHHGVCQNEDGTFSWKFDNYVRGFSPYTFSQRDAHELWGRIACPTLLVLGAESWAGDPSQDGRLDVFQDARVATIEKAGHWVHHDQLGEFLTVVRKFLAE